MSLTDIPKVIMEKIILPAIEFASLKFIGEV